MKLPTIEKLSFYVIWFAVADLVMFFYSGYPGFSSDSAGIVTVFSWLSLGLLFLCLSMVINGYLMKRELLVYFLALYVRLFALAFQMIALGIGVSHSSTLSAVFTYFSLAVTLIVELIVYGFLLVQLDDLSSNEEVDIPTDIEGAGILTKRLDEVNSWTTAFFQFCLVFIPGYGPLLKLGVGKKST